MSTASTNTLNAALKNLELLAGRWTVELIFPTDPSNVIHAQAAFEWLEGGAYLVERLADSTWLMGPDESNETYSALYHDERGVSRIYQMTLKDGLWNLWRNAPGFSQRFTGTFSDDRNTITAKWEKSTDGTHWAHDFKIMYIRIK